MHDDRRVDDDHDLPDAHRPVQRIGERPRPGGHPIRRTDLLRNRDERHPVRPDPDPHSYADGDPNGDPNGHLDGLHARWR